MKKLFAMVLSIIIVLSFSTTICFAETLAKDTNQIQSQSEKVKKEVVWATNNDVEIGKNSAGNVDYNNMNQIYTKTNLYNEQCLTDKNILSFTLEFKINKYPGLLADGADCYLLFALANTEMTGNKIAYPSASLNYASGFVIRPNNLTQSMAYSFFGNWTNNSSSVENDYKYINTIEFRVTPVGTEYYYNGFRAFINESLTTDNFGTNAHIYMMNYISKGDPFEVELLNIYNDGTPSVLQDEYIPEGENVGEWIKGDNANVEVTNDGLNITKGYVYSKEKFDLANGLMVQFDINKSPLFQEETVDINSFLGIYFKDNKSNGVGAGNGFGVKYRTITSDTGYKRTKGEAETFVTKESVTSGLGSLSSKELVYNTTHYISIYEEQDSWFIIVDGEVKEIINSIQTVGIKEKLNETRLIFALNGSLEGWDITIKSVSPIKNKSDKYIINGGSDIVEKDDKITVDEKDFSNTIITKKDAIQVDKNVKITLSLNRISEYLSNANSNGYIGLFLSNNLGVVNLKDKETFIALIKFKDRKTLTGEFLIGVDKVTDFEMAVDTSKPIEICFGWDKNNKAIITVNNVIAGYGNLSKNKFIASKAYLSVRTFADVASEYNWKYTLESIKNIDGDLPTYGEQTPTENEKGCKKKSTKEASIAVASILCLACIAIMLKK